MINSEQRDEAQLRLDELIDIFYLRTGAARASNMIERSERTGKPNLFTKLRHHTDPPGYIGDRLTRERDAFDYLLEFYSVLEIASLLKSLPEPLPPELLAQAIRDLSNPAVLRYYEKHYPMLLPKLFRKRLVHGQGVWEEYTNDDGDRSRQAAYYLFSEFIWLASWVTNDSAIETFQWFLDDGEREGYDIDDTLQVLRNRDEFAERLSRNEAEQDTLDESILGFQRFVDFCVRFDQLLSDCQFMYLYAEMYHFFGYWFIQMSHKISAYVPKALQLFATWEPLEERNRDEAKKEVADYVYLAERSLLHLINLPYNSDVLHLFRSNN